MMNFRQSRMARFVGALLPLALTLFGAALLGYAQHGKTVFGAALTATANLDATLHAEMTSQAQTAIATRATREAGTPSATPIFTLTPSHTPTRPVTNTPQAIVTSPPSRTPRPTRTPPPSPTPINPFGGLAFVNWTSQDGILKLDKPVRWTEEPVDRGGPLAYVFSLNTVPDVLVQVAVFPVSIFRSNTLTANPTNSLLLQAFLGDEYDSRLVRLAKIGAFDGLALARIVQRERPGAMVPVEFDLNTFIALMDRDLFIVVQSLAPAFNRPDMDRVVERVLRTVAVDLPGAREVFSEFLVPTATPTRAGSATPRATPILMTSTPGMLVGSLAQATLDARATARAITPTVTPAIQATVNAVVAATDAASTVQAAVQATFDARTALASTPDIPATVGAIVGATETAMAAATAATAATDGVPYQPTLTMTPFPTTAAVISPSPTAAPTLVANPASGRLFRGNPEAKVTVVEFTDFQCPFCARHNLEVYPELMRRYGEKVRFEFRHFPLETIHPDARQAGLAAECAAEQGKFWEYHDKLFENQERLSRAALILYALELKIGDQDRFVRCLDSGQYNNLIEDDLAVGFRLGVSGTPTFYVNGRAIVGAQPLSAFIDAIEAELAAAGN